MLNIVVPMAGLGSRFLNAGYETPKPLIPVMGKPMIQVVINNLKPNRPHRFIFICQKNHVLEYNLSENLQKWAPDSLFVSVERVTAGAACSVLLASSWIDNEDQLMIANSDQYINVDINEYLNTLDENTELDGLIMTMKANDPKWSYVGLDSDNMVNSVIEKKVISNEATVGIYNFRKGANFVSAAKKMIENNETTNGEFYVAPVYNYLLKEKAKVGIYSVGDESEGMYGLGTPADLEFFLLQPVAKEV